MKRNDIEIGALTIVILLVFGLIMFAANKDETAKKKIEAVNDCKASVYDTERYMESLGMKRWEFACAREAKGTLNQVIAKCSYEVKKC
jgi:hypothetical protein